MERLKKEMKKQGISQYRLAKLIGAKANTVNNWFTGRAKTPRDNYLNKIAEVLCVHPAYLKYGNKEYEPTLQGEMMYLFKETQSYVSEHPEAYDYIKKILKGIISEPEGYKKDTPVQKKKGGIYEIPAQQRKAR